MASEFDKTATPAAFEAEQKAMTDAARSGGNTYGEGCKALREKLDTTPLPDSMRARLDAGDRVQFDGASHPPIASSGPVRLPDDLLALKKSAVCDLVFDVDETGMPHSPEVRCTDPAFEAHALASLAELRFEPYKPDGEAVPVSGVLMPMEFCTNA